MQDLSKSFLQTGQQVWGRSKLKNRKYITYIFIRNKNEISWIFALFILIRFMDPFLTKSNKILIYKQRNYEEKKSPHWWVERATAPCHRSNYTVKQSLELRKISLIQNCMLYKVLQREKGSMKQSWSLVEVRNLRIYTVLSFWAKMSNMEVGIWQSAFW